MDGAGAASESGSVDGFSGMCPAGLDHHRMHPPATAPVAAIPLRVVRSGAHRSGLRFAEPGAHGPSSTLMLIPGESKWNRLAAGYESRWTSEVRSQVSRMLVESDKAAGVLLAEGRGRRIPRTAQRGRGHRRFDAGNRDALHRQLEGQHGRLVHRAGYQLPASPQSPAGPRAIHDDRPVDFARRRPALRPHDRTPRDPFHQRGGSYCLPAGGERRKEARAPLEVPHAISPVTFPPQLRNEAHGQAIRTTSLPRTCPVSRYCIASMTSPRL